MAAPAAVGGAGAAPAGAPAGAAPAGAPAGAAPAGAPAGAASTAKITAPFFGLDPSKFIEPHTERYLGENDDRVDTIQNLLDASAKANGRYFEDQINGFIKDKSENKYNPEKDETVKGLSTYKELHTYFLDYLMKNREPEKHESIGVLGNNASLNNESKLILEHLIAISTKGYITVDSQPGLIIKDHVNQIPYLKIMLPVEKLRELLGKLSRDNSYIKIVKYSITNKHSELNLYTGLSDELKGNIITIMFGMDSDEILNYPDLIPEIYNDNFFRIIENLLPDNRMSGGGQKRRRKSKKTNRKSRHCRTLRRLR